MPNLVKNVLTVCSATPKMFWQIANFVSSSSDDIFDFEKVLPTPEDLKIVCSTKYSRFKDLYYRLFTPESKYSSVLGVSEETFRRIQMTEQMWLRLGSPSPFSPQGLTQKEIDILGTRYHLYEGKEDEYPAVLIGYCLAQNVFFYGSETWYEWRLSAWGTGRRAAHAKILEEGYGWKFTTAWSVPFGVVKTLSMIFPSVIFELQYADEDIGQNCGIEGWQNGELVHKCSFLWGSSEAINFAEKLWGEEHFDED